MTYEKASVMIVNLANEDIVTRSNKGNCKKGGNSMSNCVDSPSNGWDCPQGSAQKSHPGFNFGPGGF